MCGFWCLCLFQVVNLGLWKELGKWRQQEGEGKREKVKQRNGYLSESLTTKFCISCCFVANLMFKTFSLLADSCNCSCSLFSDSLSLATSSAPDASSLERSWSTYASCSFHLWTHVDDHNINTPWWNNSYFETILSLLISLISPDESFTCTYTHKYTCMKWWIIHNERFIPTLFLSLWGVSCGDVLLWRLPAQFTKVYKLCHRACMKRKHGGVHQLEFHLYIALTYCCFILETLYRQPFIESFYRS